MPLLSRHRAVLELLFTTAMWGFSFIAIRWVLTAMDPLWLNTIQFGVSFVLGMPS